MQVAREIILVTFSDEGEDGRGSVGPFVQFPGHAADGRIRDG
jgi:hypothetical protein